MASRPLFSLKGCLRAFSASPTAIGGGELHSAIYRQSMFRPPPVVLLWGREHQNLCSFIGTVVKPVKRYARDDPCSNVYTHLEVTGPPTCPNPSSFRLLLEMRDELAEVSLKYLNPNDLIYVHGPLTFYKRFNGNDSNTIFYKVIVKELNFIIRGGKKLETESSTRGESTTPAPRGREDEYRDRLHLWQTFFANPYEWRDNRQKKLQHPSCPDFKHKDTAECLWLRPDDPPWIRRLLQVYDSNMPTLSSHRKVRICKIDDLY